MVALFILVSVSGGLILGAAFQVQFSSSSQLRVIVAPPHGAAAIAKGRYKPSGEAIRENRKVLPANYLRTVQINTGHYQQFLIGFGGA
jgi:hypothetical protein